MAAKQQTSSSRDTTRHKRKKTSIGNSTNSKNSKYRGQGK